MRHNYLSKLPHDNTRLAVPVSGLIVELMDRKKMFNDITIITPESKLLLSERHKEASNRIITCTGYLITITHRLLKPQEPLFMNLHLDWENLMVYSQVILDSFSTLVPVFYSLPEQYKRLGDSTSYRVNGFNNLQDWFLYHKISDPFTRRYKLIKSSKSWYRLLNVDRKDFIHRFKTPNIVSALAIKQAGFKMQKDKVFNMRDVKDHWVKPETVEKEVKTHLRNLLDFLTFCDFFLKKKLEQKNIYISDETQFKVSLWGYDFREFNKLVFKP